METVTLEPGPPPYEKVAMTLVNGTGYGDAILLYRWARFVPDNAAVQDSYGENYDASNDGAWGYIPVDPVPPAGPDSYGMMLQNVGIPTPSSKTHINYWQANVENSWTSPNPCIAPYVSGTIVNELGSGYIYYSLGVIRSVTATVRYLRF